MEDQKEQKSKTWCRHIPNALTILRFILIPFILVNIVEKNYVAAFVFLTISGITDVLDGYIARKYNFITNLGKVLDPLADKFTQVFILLALALNGILDMWVLVVVAIKEAAMIAVASFLYGQEFVVSSKWYGKLATVLFYLAIVSSLTIKYLESIEISIFHFDRYLYYLALAVALFAFVMYYITFYKQGFLKKENLKIEDKKDIDDTK